MKPLNEAESTQQEWNRKAKDVVNSMLRRLLGQGSTSQRPASPTNGQMFYDNTLKIPIWWNTADEEWKDAAGAGV